jgi:protein KRI1
MTSDIWGGSDHGGSATCEVDDSKLVINQSYALEYDRRKQRLESARLAQLRGGDASEGEDSDDSETEDEEADMLTASLDLQIVRAINRIRSKDPEIYKLTSKFYDSEEDERRPDREENSNAEQEKSTLRHLKPMKFKDVVREQLLSGENGADGSAPTPQSPAALPHMLAYDEEQRELRNRLMESLGAAALVGEDATGLLQVKTKSARELEEEEKQFQEELKRMSLELNPEDEHFLKDFVANRRWKESSTMVAPADETVSDTEDEVALNRQDDFEAKYNFRYQEEGAGAIRSYSRVTPGSVRREDDKRKKDRELRRTRKLEERKRKEEELRRLKNIKRVEIKRKLDAIRAMSGGIEVEEDMLEADFDPDKWDSLMASTFNEDYYNEPEADAGKGGSEANIDVELDEDECGEELPVQKDVSKKSLMDEVYKLDYEDLIGDLPCRFKYKQVEADSFGLSAEEILLANDEDLNRFVSLKKLAPYNQQPVRADARKRRRLRDAIKLKKQDGVLKTQGAAVPRPSKDNGRRRKRRNRGELLPEQETVDVNKNDKKSSSASKGAGSCSRPSSARVTSSRLASYGLG